MDRSMWRVVVISNDIDRDVPVRDEHPFWSEEEANAFYDKKNKECFNDANLYCYALKPVKVK